MTDDPTKDRPRPRLDAVGWLLGPELVGQLTKILAKRRDPRGWMPMFKGFVQDESHGEQGKLTQLEPPKDESGNARAVVVPEGDEAPPLSNGGAALADGEATFTFDYIADLGDSTNAMYAVAVACQSALNGESLDRGKELTLGAGAPDHTLPRGEFLFLGGDTAYHIADDVTVQQRVVWPFQRAAKELGLNHHDLRHRIYGIPGNHDWYADLSGFRRIFQLHGQRDGLKERVVAELPDAEQTRVKNRPCWHIGFRPVQRASYVAIRLPGNWHLWGLDIDGGLDDRQEAYFASLKQIGGIPKKLIVCTPSPPLALGGRIASTYEVTGSIARS